MKRTRFSESQIIRVLKEDETGIPVEELCRKHGVGQSTYYKWRAKYGGMELSDLKKMKVLEEENQRLKRLYAEVSLDKQILSKVLRLTISAFTDFTRSLIWPCDVKQKSD